MEKLNYNRIKAVLAEHNKTSLALAKYLGKHEQTVSGWCTNHNQPDIKTFYKIADFMNIEVSELLTRRKNLEPIKDSKKNKGKQVKKRG